MDNALHQLTWVAATAAALGVIMLRLKQPPMLGFMLAGFALGPTGFALIDNNENVRLFAELGVLLLVFVVGLEISLRAIRNVMWRAAACALIQASAALAVTVALGAVLRWPIAQSLVIGFVLSLSSTAVGIKLLESVGEARREPGRLAVAVLVAQDVLVIPMLLVTVALGAAATANVGLGGAGAPGFGLVTRILIALGLLGGLVVLLSRRGRIRIPFADAIAKNADAGPLAALAICLLGATAASLLRISPIYGAFVAGLVVGASNLRNPALRASIPIQSILLMVFFLSIGLMLDLRTLAPLLPALLIITAVVLLARTAVNAIALRLLKAPPREALIAAVAMAPLGEFGFALAAAGVGAGAISADGYQIALSVIAISMAASPIWMLAARRAVEHRETQATTVRAFAEEIFADEVAGTRRVLGRAASVIGSGTAAAVRLGSEAFGAVAARTQRRPANDLTADGDAVGDAVQVPKELADAPPPEDPRRDALG